MTPDQFDPTPHPFPPDQVPGGTCRICQLPGWHSIHQPAVRNVYDDFVASDALKAILTSDPGEYIVLYPNPRGGLLVIDGEFYLTPEQYSVVSALIPSDRGGTAPIPPKPDQE
jgi:hypothetical protein